MNITRKEGSEDVIKIDIEEETSGYSIKISYISIFQDREEEVRDSRNFRGSFKEMKAPWRGTHIQLPLKIAHSTARMMMLGGLEIENGKIINIHPIPGLSFSRWDKTFSLQVTDTTGKCIWDDQSKKISVSDDITEISLNPEIAERFAKTILLVMKQAV